MENLSLTCPIYMLAPEWCNSVQEALQKRLHALLKIWKAEVLVLNEAQARIFHLCQS